MFLFITFLSIFFVGGGGGGRESLNRKQNKLSSKGEKIKDFYSLNG